MGYSRGRLRLKRALPATIKPSEVTYTDESGSIETATALSADESVLLASSDTSSDLSPGESTVLTRTVKGVIGAGDSTKLFTVTSTSTNLDSAASQSARNADGSSGSDSESGGTHIGLIVGLVVGLTIIVLVLAFFVWRRCRRNKNLAAAAQLPDEDTSTPKPQPRIPSQSPPVPMRGHPDGAAAASFRPRPYPSTLAHEKIYQDDYTSTSYAPVVSRKPSHKSAQSGRKSWFSLKSNRTLNQHFEYFRSSRHLDDEDEELRDLPPPDASLFERCVSSLRSTSITQNFSEADSWHRFFCFVLHRSSPLSELSEKAAMKMFRKPSTTESLRQGRPPMHHRLNPRLTTMTADSSYSGYSERLRGESDYERDDYYQLSTAHFSYSGDLPKSDSFIEPRSSHY